LSGLLGGRAWIEYLWVPFLCLCAAAWAQIWLRRRARDREGRVLLAAWQAGRALIKQKKWREAVTVLDEALMLVRRRPEMEAQLHFHKGYALEGLGQLDDAVSEYAAYQAARATQPRSREDLVASFRYGHVLSRLERWDKAVEQLQQAVEGAACGRTPELRLNALRILLAAYQATQRYAEAIQCGRKALSAARDLGDEATAALVLDMTGDVCLAMGQTDDALRSYEQSLDLLRKLDQRRAALVVKRDIGKLYQASAEWDKAHTWLRACLLEEERAGDVVHQARLCYDLGCLHIANKEHEEAASWLHQSMALFRTARDRTSTDRVGRTMMGLGVLVYREAAADQMTFYDIERGLAELQKEEKG